MTVGIRAYDFLSHTHGDGGVIRACPLCVEFANGLCDWLLVVAWLVPGSLTVRCGVPSEEMFPLVGVVVGFCCRTASVGGVLWVHVSASTVGKVVDDGGSFLIVEVTEVDGGVLCVDGEVPDVWVEVVVVWCDLLL